MDATSDLRTELAHDATLKDFVDTTLNPPVPYRGTGRIRLVILGQDPTVKRAESRKFVKTVLNLDQDGALKGYLLRVCRALGLSLEANVFATNFANVFFTKPPASVKDTDILAVASKYCIPRLLSDLKPYTGVPILSLGEPLLEQLATCAASRKVREYWDYRPDWRASAIRPFRHLPACGNVLQREVFPFPHQPSIRKEFYSGRLEAYLEYMKKECFR